MSTQMIRLADAQAAIKSVIDAYQRDISAVRAEAAKRGPDEEPPEGEDALLIAARLCSEGAERARHALATCRIFEAVDFKGVRIVDKKWIPPRMHDVAEEQAIRTVLTDIGKTLNNAGMIHTRKDRLGEPTTTRIALEFTALRPMDARWEPYEIGEEAAE